MKYMQLFALVVIAGAVLVGCKKKKGAENEEELITTVKVILTEAGTTTPLTFTWKDVDGPGGNAPVIDQISLMAGKTYNCQLQFLDESKTPAEDITAEIVTEGTEHQIYYQPSGVNITVSGLNNDSGGLPLGTTSNWTTTTNSNGTLKLTLKHKPDGIKAAGDPVTKGETDVEITFTARVL